MFVLLAGSQPVLNKDSVACVSLYVVKVKSIHWLPAERHVTKPEMVQRNCGNMEFSRLLLIFGR